ncbi:hypothetical protein ACXYTJ_09040 [Gilvimarinus sp. F26214L]|uniref:hypothetical protein n=1 Tax=Gilvimarinus sp. DZF01 TaxID=3461371 RepID=UPI004045209D
MKKNLLPDMQRVKMKDRDGAEFVMWLEIRKDHERTYVFLSDTHQVGESKLAQDAMFLIEKVKQRLKLDPETTRFFRHIYQEQLGSTFGRFDVDWQGSEPNYRFRMLTNLEDIQEVQHILESTRPFRFGEVTRKAATA